MEMPTRWTHACAEGRDVAHSFSDPSRGTLVNLVFIYLLHVTRVGTLSILPVYIRVAD